MPVSLILVDDHELLRTGLKLRLQREEGLRVVQDFSSAEEAYAAIAISAPDLIVLDLDLPGDNGITAAAKIRARWPQTKILILTGSKPSSITAEALQAGADGLVCKKEASDELVRAIHALIAGKSYLSPEATHAVVNTIRTEPKTRSPETKAPQLTDQETSVLKLLAEGMSYKEIASELGVSVKTIETYRARMIKKLGCSTRAELVRYAVRKGLIQA